MLINEGNPVDYNKNLEITFDHLVEKYSPNAVISYPYFKKRYLKIKCTKSSKDGNLAMPKIVIYNDSNICSISVTEK